MIARSAQTAALALLAVTLVSSALPSTAAAYDRDHGSRGDGYQYVDHRGGDRDDDHGGHRYESPRHHGWGHREDHYDGHYRYAPRYYYYPDVVVYPYAPRVYYPAPYYAPVEPAYPSDYGTVGIHLDYNLRY